MKKKYMIQGVSAGAGMQGCDQKVEDEDEWQALAINQKRKKKMTILEASLRVSFCTASFPVGVVSGC